MIIPGDETFGALSTHGTEQRKNIIFGNLKGGMHLSDGSEGTLNKTECEDV